MNGQFANATLFHVQKHQGERANGLVGLAVRAKGNAATTELLKCNKNHYFALIDSNFFYIWGSIATARRLIHISH